MNEFDAIDSLFTTAIESAMPAFYMDYDVAMEGVNIDALKMVNDLRKQAKELKREMHAAEKAKKFNEAAKKADEISKLADKFVLAIDKLPSSVGSAVISGLILFIVALVASIGMSKIGQSVGKKLGSNASSKAVTKAMQDGINEGYSANNISETNDEFDVIMNKLAVDYDVAQEKFKKSNTAYVTFPNRGISIKGMPDYMSAEDKTLYVYRGESFKEVLDRHIDKLHGYTKKVYEYKIAKGVVDSTGKNIEEAVRKNQALGKYAGKVAGSIAGAGAITVPYAISMIKRITHGKVKVNEDGSTEKVMLNANDWNALIKFAKSIIVHMRIVYSKKAQEYRNRVSANESFGTFDNFIASYASISEDASCEFIPTDDVALEACVDTYFESAMEGVNIDAFRLVNELRKQTQSIKKEMKAAEKEKKFEVAARKAEEIAKLSNDFVRAIDKLPSSVGSAIISGVILFLASVIITVGLTKASNAIIKRVDKKLGYRKSATRLKNADRDAKREVDKALSIHKDDSVSILNNTRDICKREYEAMQSNFRDNPHAEIGFVEVIFEDMDIESKDFVVKKGESFEDSWRRYEDTLSKSLKLDRDTKREEIYDDTFSRRVFFQHNPNSAKSKAPGIIGKVGGAVVTMPYVISMIKRITHGKVTMDENGNAKNVPLNANDWNALVKFAKSLANSMRDTYKKKAQEYRDRISNRASESFGTFDQFISQYCG